ncbi:MAG: hypothetical protein H0T57_16345 [Rubrobacter sp.]|jgi:hypothetical protein|nr:hypothetical protein [Rubrobacter sp.]MBA3616076.1 hypothetical protein [Rubrobacteraceae bacterium]
MDYLKLSPDELESVLEEFERAVRKTFRIPEDFESALDILYPYDPLTGYVELHEAVEELAPERLGKEFSLALARYAAGRQVAAKIDGGTVGVTVDLLSRSFMQGERHALLVRRYRELGLIGE